MRRNLGFTLFEVLIVMAIVGILAAVAFPSYSSYVAKTRRGAAAGCATEIGQLLERNYTLALSYSTDSAGNALPAAPPAMACSNDLGTNFTFTWDLAATTYTVTATPSATQKSADSACGCVMTLNQVGVKGVSACTKTVANCWR